MISSPIVRAQPDPAAPVAPAPDDLWRRAGDFFMTFSTLFEVLAIIVGAIVLRIVLHFVIQRVVNRIVSGVKRRSNTEDTQSILASPLASPLAAVRVVQRTRTLGSVLNNVVSVVIVIVALLLIVTAIDANIIGSFALITAALGAGLGFGAQNIVKDVLNGLFMVAEDQLGVGDVVDVGPATGVVEAVGIRITSIRSVDGTLWYVRNGEILRVGNKSQGWARAIVDLAVPYTADVEEVQASMLRAAMEMWESREWHSKIIEKPEIWGIESISADALVVRIVMKTRTAVKDDVARELRLRLKYAMDALGVELPALDVSVANDASASAAPPAPLPAPVAVDTVRAPVRRPAASAAARVAPGSAEEPTERRTPAEGRSPE